MTTGILTLSCPDRPGLVHAVSGYLVSVRANIVESAQFEDVDTVRFFMRIRFDLLDDATDLDAVRRGFAAVAAAYDMTWEITDAATPARDARARVAARPLPQRPAVPHPGRHAPDHIPAVVSNHDDLRGPVESAGIAVPPRPGDARRARPTPSGACSTSCTSCRSTSSCSPATCRSCRTTPARRSAGRAINIHHSFLPAFVGAKPYHQAHVRGVKLIGATAHYVTSALDEGPIIEQDVARVDHAMAPSDLAAAGHDVEAQVLARAVRWHAERRVLLNGDRTVVVR